MRTYYINKKDLILMSFSQSEVSSHLKIFILPGAVLGLHSIY